MNKIFTDSSAKRVYAAVQDPKPEAIVVHCSDPRFQIAFEQFIANELGLAKGEFIPLVIGGGPGVLSHPEQLPKEFKFIKERFELYRTHFPSIRRVILINHEDCKYYQSLRTKLSHLLGARFKGVAEQAREDLGLLARICDRLLAHLGLSVDLYYAKFADAEHSKAVFEKVDN
jgi:hypothetical protein